MEKRKIKKLKNKIKEILVLVMILIPLILIIGRTFPRPLSCDKLNSENFICVNVEPAIDNLCRCYNLSNPDDVKVIYKMIR